MTEPAAPSRTSLAALRPLLPYAFKYRGRILAAFAALAVASVATLIVPYAIHLMIDRGFGGADTEAIKPYFLGLFAVVIALALSSGMRFYLVMTLGERVVADLRADLFAHLTKLDLSFFDAERTGELVSRLSTDTTQLKAAFGSSASVALRNLFLVAGAVAMMVVTSPKLSAYALVAIPIIILPLYAAGRSVRGRAKAAQDRLADATAFASESLSGVRVMQAFTAEAASAARYRAASDDAFDAAKAMTRARAIVTVAALFLAFGSVVAVLWFGARDVLAHEMTGGELSQFLLYAVFGASSLGELSQVWSEVSAAAGAAARIAELLGKAPRVASPASPRRLANPPRGELAFDNVAFAYPTRPDLPALKGVTFAVARGEVVAIVGASGAGKSTLFQLAERFYDPQSGAVRFDGADVRTLDLTALRGALALVPQDPFIFAASVAENIAYGRPGASQEAVVEAATRAAAHDFIEALPQGYETQLGERGATLSGGERQRVAIARALLKDAPTLLLDEATSALDSANEAIVQKALEELMKGRTTLVIAHRLATIVKADRIVALQDGVVAEIGTHAELLARGGVYARLAALQFKNGTVDAT